MTSQHLIVQANDIETGDLKILHALSNAAGIEKIEGDFEHQAFRLLNADPGSKARIQLHCEKVQIDFGFVGADAALANFGLIAMDMDSTLITIECIDEIADFAGKKKEVGAVTAAAMRGEINWPTSLRQRVGALAGLPAQTLQQVYEQRLQLSPGAQQLVTAARRANIKLLLVSGGFTYFTDKLKARLSFDHAFSNQLEIVDGRLTGQVLGPLCDAGAKAEHVRSMASGLSLRPDQIMVIGDGANDLPMMRTAGTSIAYRAKPVVRSTASYAINHLGLDAVLALFPPNAR